MANSWPKWRRRAAHINKRLSQGATIEDLANEYDVSPKSMRNRIGELKSDGLLGDDVSPEDADDKAQKKDKGKMDIHKDGSCTSYRDRLWMRAEKITDHDELMRLHGFEPEHWEFISAGHNQWETYSKQDGIIELYGSKITVKPKASKWTLDKLIDTIEQLEPVELADTYEPVDDKRLLEIPLLDQHFGISDLEWYKPTQYRIFKLITSRRWEQILFIIGQDTLHVDNFKNTTANGTPIEPIDLPKAWDDCWRFYYPLIRLARFYANSVKVMYSSGNHDQSMSWAFVKMLKVKFRKCEFDVEVKERKAHTFGSVFIGVTHGDKAKKNLHNIFPVEFPIEWSRANVRELHSGHYHVEDAKDTFGMMVRTLATRNKTDQWHKDNGFVGAHKRFQLFEYSTDELLSIHYV